MCSRVQNEADKLSRLLYCLAVIPTGVFLCLEANVHSVIRGRLRVYNAVDLGLMTFFYHFLFEVINLVGNPNHRLGDLLLTLYAARTGAVQCCFYCI